MSSYVIFLLSNNGFGSFSHVFGAKGHVFTPTLVPWRAGNVGGLRGLACYVKLITITTPRTRTTAPSSRGPGVLFVLYSSVKCNSLKYCNRPFVRAPYVSRVTRRNVQFARTCTKDPIDTPSHTAVVAKRRDKRKRIENGGRC